MREMVEKGRDYDAEEEEMETNKGWKEEKEEERNKNSLEQCLS